MTPHKKLLVVAGPTASGKTSLALALAANLRGEIVNFDSVQLYRGFDIGSAKPTPAEKQRVPHHLFDIADWRRELDARGFAKEAQRVVKEIWERGRVPVLVGGTGLYLRAFWEDYFHNLPKDDQLRQELEKLSNEELRAELLASDPERAAQIHPNDRYRLGRAVELARLLGHPLSQLPETASAGFKEASCTVILKPNRQWLHERIALRTKNMLQAGLVEEVKRLLMDGCPPDARPMQSIGYKQVTQFLGGELAAKDLENAIIFATRQYAKRQDTWFGKVACDCKLTPPQKEAEMAKEVVQLWQSLSC